MTQVETLRAAFDRGESHTIFTAMTQLGVGALHQRCGDLKRTGYPVAREVVKINGKSVAQFRRSEA